MVAEKYKKIMKKASKIVHDEEPISTGLIAKKLSVNWATAQRALNELEREGKIKGKAFLGEIFGSFQGNEITYQFAIIPLYLSLVISIVKMLYNAMEVKNDDRIKS